MAMNYKEVPQGIPKTEAKRYAKGIQLVSGFVESLRRQGLLPEWFSKPETSTIASPAPTTPVAVEAPAVKISETFEIPTVSKELYLKTREALKKEGYTFVVAIESLSIGHLASDPVISQRFSYVNSSEDMRSIVPQQIEVSINPKKLRIKNSNSKSTDIQIKMIKDEEAALKGKLREGVRDIISMSMPNASVLSQLDSEYQKETGKVLFTDWFGRADDQTVSGFVAVVGRFDPTSRLLVLDWVRASLGIVFAVPVVVLPRKLAV